MVLPYRETFIALIIIFLSADTLKSQSLGNPVRNLYKDEFSIGVNGEIGNQDMETVELKSSRLLTKVGYGVNKLAFHYIY